MPKLRLYFIPHAGGSAMGYMAMKRFISIEGLELVPLELAGRGTRIKEPCLEAVKDTVEDLFSRIKEEIKETDYAIFGHSLGGLLAYELVKKIEKENLPEPKCIFISGRCAPFVHIPLEETTNQQELDRKLALHAIPKELQGNQELLQLILPILHADIKMAKDYVYMEGAQLNTDIYTLYGKQDLLVTKEGMEEWNQMTKKDCNCNSFEGDHFYYTKQRKEVGETITKALQTYL
ncbi:MAG: thioesterase domain-containing protein [bacterium]|nr:thioesterase domain-containing protein [bacterium]